MQKAPCYTQLTQPCVRRTCTNQYRNDYHQHEHEHDQPLPPSTITEAREKQRPQQVPSPTHLQTQIHVPGLRRNERTRTTPSNMNEAYNENQDCHDLASRWVVENSTKQRQIVFLGRVHLLIVWKEEREEKDITHTTKSSGTSKVGIETNSNSIIDRTLRTDTSRTQTIQMNLFQDQKGKRW